MKILSYLYENNTPIGVRLDDAGESYIVPMTGLYDTVIFEELLNSGYKLIDQSKYEFEYEGASTLTTLPKEEYRLTDEERIVFDNFELEHEFVSKADLITKQVQKQACLEFEGPVNGDYIINTRDELLAYLQKNQGCYTETDILPLNAFVAPTARFSLVELREDTNNVIRLMADRRRMSRARFNNYVKWVEGRIGHKPTLDEMLNEYMKFGIDGVNANIVATCNPPTDNRNIFLNKPTNYNDPSDVARSSYHTTFYALVGNNANAGMDDYILYEDTIPDGLRTNPMFYEDTDPTSQFAQQHKNLSYNEYLPEKMIRPYVGILHEWTTSDGSIIQFDLTHIKYVIHYAKDVNDPSLGTGRDLRVASMLGVENPSEFSHPLPIDEWLISQEEAVTRATLRALASDLIQRRKVPCNDTTFSILMENGFTPGAAIRHIAAGAGCMDIPNTYDQTSSGVQERAGDATVLYVGDKDIYTYFKNNENPASLTDYYGTTMTNGVFDRTCLATAAQKEETINDAMNGSINGDSIMIAKMREADYDVEKVYSFLYTAHKIFNIPISVIESKIENLSEEDTSFTLSNDDGKYITVPAPKLDMAVSAANATRFNIKKMIADNAPIFYYIDDVATEFTNDPAKSNRAVGVSGFRGCIYDYTVGNGLENVGNVTPKLNQLGKLVETLIEEYKDYCAESSPTPLTIKERDEIAAKAGQIVKTFLCRAVKFNGKVTDKNLPPHWYSIKDDFTRWSIMQSSITRFYASTAFICETMFSRCLPYNKLGQSFEDYGPTYNCLNAIVTPTAVYPTGVSIMHQTPLRVVFEQRIIGKSYDNLKSYLANYIAPDGSGAWDVYFFEDNHINPIQYRRHINEEFSARNGSYNHAKVATACRTYYYRALAGVGLDVDEAKKALDDVIASDLMAPIAHDTDLFRYVHECKEIITHEKQTGERCIAPKHPIENLYPSIYGDPDHREMVKDNPTPYQTFKLNPATCLAGPKFNESEVNGLTVVHVSPRNNQLMLTTSKEEFTVSYVFGYTIEEIVNCPTILNTCIDTTKLTVAVVGNKFFISENSSIKEISAEELFKLDPEKYAVRHVTGRILHFLDAEKKIRRIKR